MGVALILSCRRRNEAWHEMPLSEEDVLLHHAQGETFTKFQRYTLLETKIKRALASNSGGQISLDHKFKKFV